MRAIDGSGQKNGAILRTPMETKNVSKVELRKIRMVAQEEHPLAASTMNVQGKQTVQVRTYEQACDESKQ
jgi:hypothetical protein